MLTSRHDPETTLRRLNEAGVFGRFVPDFGRVVAQTQHDMYHTYTVDEHTIRAIGILARIENGDAEGRPSAVGRRGPSRSCRGRCSISRCCCTTSPRAAAATIRCWAPMSPWRSARVSASARPRPRPSPGWCATTSSCRRPRSSATSMDPKTIETFAALVQSPERLRLLLVLTVCDIRAVGPNVWNGWKAALLRQLYNAAERVMSGGTLSGGRAERIKAIQSDVGQRLAGLDRGREGRAFRARLRALLAVVPDRRPGAPSRAGAPRRARPPATRHRAPG